MSPANRSWPWPPTVDLATVRKTLVYMRDDLSRIEELKSAASALDHAVREIEKAELSLRCEANRKITSIEARRWTQPTLRK
ncbi:MAG: hypothetical protein AAGH90_12620 [Pseudomonadota bacterium]